jgi:tripartite-type tricarboxylate transporter receptor subunit TctC
LANPAIRARLAEVATNTPIVFTLAEFGAYVASEVDKWGKVITAAGVRPE